MSKNKDKLKIAGKVTLVLKGPDGTIKKKIVTENIVVSVGFTEMAKLLASSTGFARPTHIGVGTGNAAPTLGDTALVAELLRKVIATTGQAANKVTYTVQFAPGEATGALEEAGMFDAAVSGNMWARFLTGSFNKGANDTLDITWALLFN